MQLCLEHVVECPTAHTTVNARKIVKVLRAWNPDLTELPGALGVCRESVLGLRIVEQQLASEIALGGTTRTSPAEVDWNSPQEASLSPHEVPKARWRDWQ